MDILKKYLPYLLAFLLGFIAGHFFCQKTTEPEKIDAPPIVKTEYKTQTKTEVVYVPKDNGEKTDVEVNVPKQDLNIKVNGKDAVFSRSDNEDYIFERNKLVFDQKSSASINIKVPTIDKTKRNAVGLGLESHKNDFYSTISYQRVYKVNKAVEAEIHYDVIDKKVNGVGIEHKWLF